MDLESRSANSPSTRAVLPCYHSDQVFLRSKTLQLASGLCKRPARLQVLDGMGRIRDRWIDARRVKDGYVCWMNKSSRQLQKALALPLEICQTKLATACLPFLRHRFLAPDVQMLPREGRGQGFSGITQPGKSLCPRTSLPLGIMRYTAQTAFLYMGMGWGKQPVTAFI